MSELLTQLQDQLDTISRKFYECVGVLQRDAPPVSVSGEQLIAVAPAAGFNLQDTVKRMAVEIREQVQVTEQLIQLLPDGMGVNPEQEAAFGTEQAQHSADAPVSDSTCSKGFEQEVLELQQEHQRVANDLEAAASEAEDVLLQLQDLHAALARMKLRARAQQPGHMP